MTVIFTDIDGVLFNTTSNSWNKTAISLYNKLCDKFNLQAVISSTWYILKISIELFTIKRVS